MSTVHFDACLFNDMSYWAESYWKPPVGRSIDLSPGESIISYGRILLNQQSKNWAWRKNVFYLWICYRLNILTDTDEIITQYISTQVFDQKRKHNIKKQNSCKEKKEENFFKQKKKKNKNKTSRGLTMLPAYYNPS